MVYDNHSYTPALSIDVPRNDNSEALLRHRSYIFRDPNTSKYKVLHYRNHSSVLELIQIQIGNVTKIFLTTLLQHYTSSSSSSSFTRSCVLVCTRVCSCVCVCVCVILP